VCNVGLAHGRGVPEEAPVRRRIMCLGVVLPRAVRLMRLRCQRAVRLSGSRRDANDAEAARLEAVITDALENLGQTEQLDAFKAKAEFYDRIGDKVRVAPGGASQRPRAPR
jgi:hypothetical protein